MQKVNIFLNKKHHRSDRNEKSFFTKTRYDSKNFIEKIRMVGIEKQTYRYIVGKKKIEVTKKKSYSKNYF